MNVKEFYSDLDDAISAGQKHLDEDGFYSHVVLVPDQDPDDDPDIAEWYEYNSPYDPYEIVWTNYPD